MIRRGFVRAVWGTGHRPVEKIHKEIQLASQEPIKLSPHKVFCWGTDNFDLVKQCGFDAILVSDQPYWNAPPSVMFRPGDPKLNFATLDIGGQFWKHKLIAFKLATDFFEEFIFVDWDFVPKVNLPEDFWERFQERGAIQGLMMVYHRRQLLWKNVDQRKLVSACFVYIRDKTIPDKLLEIYDTNQGWREEQCLTYYIDMVLGNLPHTDNEMSNLQHYSDRHEAWCCEHPKGMNRFLATPLQKTPLFQMDSHYARKFVATDSGTIKPEDSR